MARSVVETLIIEIAGDSKKFKQELKSLQKSNKDGQKSFEKLALVGKAGFLAVAAAATAFGIASTKAFIAFEKGLTNVAKTTNLAGRDLEVLKHEIMSLSEEIPQTTSQLLEIATAAGQLGIQGTKDLAIFTETIAKLGATTDLEGGDAAVAIARILNLTGEGTETVDAFGSAIVDLGNNFATSESQILEVAKEVAKATVNFNLSSPEILGMSAAMSSLGIAAEAGSTVVSKAFMKIDDVIRSQAGPQFEKLIELTGMTGDQLTKTFKTDAVKVFESFVIGLGEAGESGKSMSAELNELGLSGIRVEKILPSLAKRSDILTDALGRSNKAAGENTALNKEAATAFGTTASQLTIAGNKVNNLAIALGEKLAPALIFATDAMINFLGLNKTLAQEIVDSTNDIETLSAAFDEYGEATKLLVKNVKKELDTLDRNAKGSLEAQKKVSDELIKDKEDTAEKSEEIAKATAINLKKIESDKLAFILKSNQEFKKLMDELVAIEAEAAKETARIRKESNENRAFAMRQAVKILEEAAKDFSALNLSQNVFEKKAIIGKGKPGAPNLGLGGEGLDTPFDFSGVSGVAAGAGKQIAGQVTGVGGAISGFQQGGLAGAGIGFATEILLSNEEFREALEELSLIITEAFGPIIHELIPVLRAVGRVLKVIAPALKKIAPFIGPLATGVEFLADVIVKLTDTMGGVDEGLDSLKEVIEAILEPIKDLTEPLEELREPFEDLIKAVDELTGPISGLDGSMASLEKSVDALQKPFRKLIRALSGGAVGNILGLTDGGIVPGSGSGDIVPAMLEPGELVVPKGLTSSLLNISPGFGNIQIPTNNQSSNETVESEQRVIVDVIIQPDEMTNFISAQQRKNTKTGVSHQ